MSNPAPKSEGGGKNGVSGVLGFTFACGRRPHAKLNRRTERGFRTVAANMSSWTVDYDIGGAPDRALHPGPAHEEILPWAGRLGALGPLGSLGAGPAHKEVEFILMPLFLFSLFQCHFFSAASNSIICVSAVSNSTICFSAGLLGKAEIQI